LKVARKNKILTLRIIIWGYTTVNYYSKHLITTAGDGSNKYFFKYNKMQKIAKSKSKYRYFQGVPSFNRPDD
jgi:hypothetical protein